MALDFDRLRNGIKRAVTTSFLELRAAHPTEHFYAVALYTDDGMTGISAAANSEEGLARRAAHYQYSVPDQIRYLRWSTSEWEYEGFGSDRLAESYRVIMDAEDRGDDDEDSEVFGRFWQRILILMTEVLAEMDADGVFGRGQDRERMTLLCTITDSEYERLVADESVHALNPRPVVARYESDWMPRHEA